MTRRTAQNTVRRFFVIIRYFADEPAEENIVPLYHTAIARRSDSEALSELPRNLEASGGSCKIILGLLYGAGLRIISSPPPPTITRGNESNALSDLPRDFDTGGTPARL